MSDNRPTTAIRLTAMAAALSQTHGEPVAVHARSFPVSVARRGCSAVIPEDVNCSACMAFSCLETAVLLTKPLTHKFRQGVEDEGEHEQYQRRQEQDAVMGARYFRL